MEGNGIVYTLTWGLEFIYNDPVPWFTLEEQEDYQRNRLDPNNSAILEKPANREIPAGIFEATLPIIMAALKEWQPPKTVSGILHVRKPRLGRLSETGAIGRRDGLRKKQAYSVSQ
ncbi:MAG: hypothetical protein HN416_17645 [Nitrospina sp.]|jgi:hypothetical protein|nr:hypothetical protein [Nitrospina sp.]